jgi:hypothetical protein
VDDLIAFLNARLDEDERTAEALMTATRMAGRMPDFTGCGGPCAEDYWKRFSEGRMLREVAAKRAVIREVLDYESRLDAEYGCGHSAEAIANSKCRLTRPGIIDALVAMVAVYSDHPDYKPEWKP